MTARSVPMLFALKEWEPAYESKWRRACGFLKRLGAPGEIDFATAKWGTAIRKKFAGFLWTRPVELAR